jgi:hypothetical protein
MANKNYSVTDSQADESLRTLKTGAVVVAREFFVQPDECPPDSVTEQDLPAEDQLSPVELRFLTAVVDFPMRSATDYIKLAHISPNTLSQIRPDLVERNFIREHKLDSGGRGRTQIKLEPLEAAQKAVANLRGKQI